MKETMFFTSRQYRFEAGVVTVEAAIIMLAFFVFILGIMEAGRFIGIQQTLTDAAREGARLAVAPEQGTSNLPSEAAIQAMVQGFLDSANISGATVMVERPVTTPSGDVYTRVTASVPYQVLTISMFTNLEVTLSGTSLMRNETSP